MNFLKYRLWPWFKVRLTYWWWIIKYRGKKNIPRAVVFGQMTKSMAQMSENLEHALRAMPPDNTPKETRELIDLIRTAKELEQEAGNLGR